MPGRSTQPARSAKTTRRRGRPQRIPHIERKFGIRIEEHVALRMQQGDALPMIAGELNVSLWALRRELRRRGYRGVCETRLAKIDPPDQGGAGRRAR